MKKTIGISVAVISCIGIIAYLVNKEKHRSVIVFDDNDVDDEKIIYDLNKSKKDETTY